MKTYEKYGKGDLDKNLECATPKSWSKYTSWWAVVFLIPTAMVYLMNHVTQLLAIYIDEFVYNNLTLKEKFKPTSVNLF